MSSVAYGDFIIEVKNAILEKLRQAASFNGAVFADYIKVPTNNPLALLRIEADSLSDQGPMVTLHNIVFRIEVQYVGGYSEGDLDNLISYVGELVDIVEDDRKFGSSLISNTEITRIDYTARAGESAVIHFVHIRLNVECLRNA